MKRDFDTAALTWDEEPRRVALVHEVAASIAETVPLSTGMDALDFGCGTGLLTLQLQPHVRTVTGVDNSRGMLDMLVAKTERFNIGSVSTVLWDMESGDTLHGTYHLITSSMAFHHVKDIRSLLKVFYSILAPGGYVAVADLDSDDGQFHEDGTGVHHNGFDRDALSRLFMDAGFEHVSCKTATTVSKPSADGQVREFPVFLMTARK